MVGSTSRLRLDFPFATCFASQGYIQYARVFCRQRLVLFYLGMGVTTYEYCCGCCFHKLTMPCLYPIPHMQRPDSDPTLTEPDESGLTNEIGRNWTDSNRRTFQLRRGPEAGSPTPAKEMAPRVRATAPRTQEAVSAVMVAPRHPARTTRHPRLETPSAVGIARR